MKTDNNKNKKKKKTFTIKIILSLDQNNRVFFLTTTIFGKIQAIKNKTKKNKVKIRTDKELKNIKSSICDQRKNCLLYTSPSPRDRG